MTTFKIMLSIIAVGVSISTNSQNVASENYKAIDKTSYYEKRAKEDAEFEQQFEAENEKEEKEFWKEQKAYERDLKCKDRKAYRAYMRGKKDAYAEHYEHCNSHCHHGNHYYNHASFYYYRYDGYYYDRYPRRSTTVRTNVRLSTPRIRVGLGL